MCDVIYACAKCICCVDGIVNRGLCVCSTGCVDGREPGCRCQIKIKYCICIVDVKGEFASLRVWMVYRMLVLDVFYLRISCRVVCEYVVASSRQAV